MSAAALPESIGERSSPAPGPGASDFAWRVLRLLNFFRVLIAAILLLTFLYVTDPRIVGEFDPPIAATALIALLVVGLGEMPLLAKGWPASAAQTYFQFAFDVTAITTLLHASGGIGSGLGGLLVVTVGSLALLVPLQQALLFAAVATLALLGEQSLALARGMTTNAEFAQAGILGAVIFVITGVVQLLRHRIVETEALAEQRGVDLQNLVELNDYIIQHLRESIVVVDGDDRIRLINESAAKLLDAPAHSHGRPLSELTPQLAGLLGHWRRASGSETAADVLGNSDDLEDIQPHFARLGKGRDEGVAIFLEDTSLIAERVQQTKLAALGRLSASIAHEIRNPLGALSHAGQLLAESDSVGPEDRRLTDIIRVNSRRVSQIVDSVLAVSRSDRAHPETIEIKRWAIDFATEYTNTQELYEGAVSVDPGSVEIEIEMDRTHLHQIVWNLCDNAVKYASAAAGAIAVELACGYLETTGRPYLEVADRGAGVDPELIDQIFEPFYTGQPGGTGLGLYISRELCERNHAALRYHPRPGGGSIFRIVFTDPHRWQAREE